MRPFLRYRKPLFELLEDRHLLAGVTVSNNNDVVNGNVTSIANLFAKPGADGISLREAIQAANTDATADDITFNAATWRRYDLAERLRRVRFTITQTVDDQRQCADWWIDDQR